MMEPQPPQRLRVRPLGRPSPPTRRRLSPLLEYLDQLDPGPWTLECLDQRVAHRRPRGLRPSAAGRVLAPERPPHLARCRMQ